jgi:hypothetical protein
MKDRSIVLTPWILATVAAGLGAVVWFSGTRSDQLVLLSTLASGLLIALVVTIWELARRKEEQRREQQRATDEAAAAEQRLLAIQRTLTNFMGAELTGIAAQVQLVGVDDEGNPLELFDDIDQAMHAFEGHQGAERVLGRVGHYANQAEPPQQLVLATWDAFERFFFWFESQFQPMLTFFVGSGDDRIVNALLELRRTEYSHRVVGYHLWTDGAPPGWLQNMTDNKAQWAAYLGQVGSPVLLRYAELLRAIEGVPSGIAHGGNAQ